MPHSPTADSSDPTTAVALQALRQLVADQAATPDCALPPERDLARRFGVGRRAVRRALSVLEGEGQLWRRQGKGTFIGPSPPRSALNAAQLANRTNFTEVMEARLYLEPVLASLAAVRASGAQMALLRQLAESARQQQRAERMETGALERRDGALHRGIAQAAGNRLLLDLFEMVDAVRRDPAWLALRQGARNHERLAGYCDDHDRIIRAIEARDPAEAARAMRAHLRALQAAATQAIDAELESGL